MAALLTEHYDGAPNYECQVLTSADSRIDEAGLRGRVREAFRGVEGADVIFYFSGHGMVSDAGGYLVTQDARMDDHGYPMFELLHAANVSRAKSVLILLDCCHAGSIGSNPGEQYNQVTLAEGVTVLAASTGDQESGEAMGNSIFTSLVLDALSGGAADIRGRVSAAAVYAYVEQALGAWQQRPMYKSHAKELDPIRLCEASVDDRLLRELSKLFTVPTATIDMDPTFEKTVEERIDDHVALFDKFKILRNAGLLETCQGEDLYDAAMKSGAVRLTPQGRFYWKLSSDRRI